MMCQQSQLSKKRLELTCTRIELSAIDERRGRNIDEQGGTVGGEYRYRAAELEDAALKYPST